MLLSELHLSENAPIVFQGAHSAGVTCGNTITIKLKIKTTETNTATAQQEIEIINIWARPGYPPSFQSANYTITANLITERDMPKLLNVLFQKAKQIGNGIEKSYHYFDSDTWDDISRNTIDDFVS